MRSVASSIGEDDWVLLRGNTELVVERVVPDLWRIHGRIKRRRPTGYYLLSRMAAGSGRRAVCSGSSLQGVLERV